MVVEVVVVVVEVEVVVVVVGVEVGVEVVVVDLAARTTKLLLQNLLPSVVSVHSTNYWATV